MVGWDHFPIDMGGTSRFLSWMNTALDSGMLCQMMVLGFFFLADTAFDGMKALISLCPIPNTPNMCTRHKVYIRCMDRHYSLYRTCYSHLHIRLECCLMTQLTILVMASWIHLSPAELGHPTEGLHFGSELKDHASNTRASMDLDDKTCMLHRIRDAQSLDGWIKDVR